MGMTDKQFNGFVRLMLATLRKALAVMPEGKEKEELKELIDNLQTIIED